MDGTFSSDDTETAARRAAQGELQVQPRGVPGALLGPLVEPWRRPWRPWEGLQTSPLRSTSTVLAVGDFGEGLAASGTFDLGGREMARQNGSR